MNFRTNGPFVRIAWPTAARQAGGQGGQGSQASVWDKNVQGTGIAMYRWADAAPLADFFMESAVPRAAIVVRG